MPWFKTVKMKVTQVICREYEHSLVLLLNVNFHFFTWASCWYCDLISSPVPIRGRKKALFKTCIKQKNIGIFLRYVGLWSDFSWSDHRNNMLKCLRKTLLNWVFIIFGRRRFLTPASSEKILSSGWESKLLIFFFFLESGHYLVFFVYYIVISFFLLIKHNTNYFISSRNGDLLGKAVTSC